MLVSLVAVYNWDNSLFEHFHLPDGVVLPLLVDEILQELGELSVIYSDPTYLKHQIAAFTRRKVPIWTRLYELATAEYNPLDNYKRTITETTAHGKKQEISKSEVHTDSETLAHGHRQQTDTSESKGGSETLAHGHKEKVDDKREEDYTNRNNVFGFDSQDAVGKDTQTAESGYIDNLVRQHSGSDVTTKTANGQGQNIVQNSGQDVTTKNGHSNAGETIQDSGSDIVTTVGQGNIGVTTYQKMISEELEVRPKLDVYKIIIDDFKHEFCVCVY